MSTPDRPLSGSVTVVARLQCLPGHEEAFRAALAPAVAATRAEDGCLAYDPHVDTLDSTVLWMVERWASPEALEAHGRSEHLRAFGKAVREIAAGRPEVHVTTALEV